MPNWCDTTITILGTNAENIKNLCDNIEKWMKNYGDGSTNGWLGNIIHNAGLGEWNDEFWSYKGCRGWVSYLDCDDEAIMINVEDAWSPHMMVWQKLVEKYMPEGEVIYRAYEPGMSYAATNDPAYIGHYILDSTQGFEEDLSLEDVAKEFNVGVEGKDNETIWNEIQSAIEKHREENPDEWMNVYAWSEEGIY